MQVLGGAVTNFSQGIAYFHSGVELLRSKSGDRNSFDSGDWFNRLDFTLADNGFGSGLPPQADNGALWPALKPLLADASIKPTAADMRFTRDAFLDLLRIRASSTLFRLRTADEVSSRLRLRDSGSDQTPTVVAGHLQGRGLPGAGFAEVPYAINVGTQATLLQMPELKGRAFVLQPGHRAASAADARPAALSRWDIGSGTLQAPPRTAVVDMLDRITRGGAAQAQAQCPACTLSPAFSRYTVPQYGQRPSPAVATSMKTLGWLLHNGMRGLGQKVTPGPSRSAAASSTTALGTVLMLMLMLTPRSATQRTSGCGRSRCRRTRSVSFQ